MFRDLQLGSHFNTVLLCLLCSVYSDKLLHVSIMQILTMLLSQLVFFISNVFVGHLSDDPINLDVAGRFSIHYGPFILSLHPSGLGFTVSVGDSL